MNLGQKGIVHIFPLLVAVIAIAAAAIWFFYSKGGLEIGKTSIEDKIASLQPKPFKDVSGDNDNYTAIKYLAREGVLEADEDGNFNPKSVVSRAEWAGMLAKLTGITPDKNIYRNCFSDVGEGMGAAAICFAKEQGWLEGFGAVSTSRSYWQLTQPVLAQEGNQSFNPGNPAKKSEAIDSLSRLMNWPTDQPVAFAKERKITDGKIEDLTRGEAAGTIYRSLATVSLGNDTFSPKMEHQVERYKIENLIDLKDSLARQRDEERVRMRKAREMKMAKLIGKEAAAEIMATTPDGSEAESSAFVRKLREKKYEDLLAEDKASGREDPTYNILELLQKVFAARGVELSMDNLWMYKRTPPHYENKERISEPLIKSRDSAEITLFLDGNYRVLSRAHPATRYFMSIALASFSGEGRDLWWIASSQLINLETGIIERASSSRWYNPANLAALFEDGISGLEAEIGQQFAPGITVDKSSTQDKAQEKTDDSKKTQVRGKAPIIEKLGYTQLHASFEETPHRYLLKATASDPEGTSLTFVWKIDCGYFVGVTTGQQIEWHYDTPGECVDASVTVKASDSEGNVAEKTQKVF